MFIDFNGAKIQTLLAIIAVLCFSVWIFLYSNAVWNLVPQAEGFWNRQRSQFMYLARYKWPSGNALVANGMESSGNARSIPVLLYHGEGVVSDMPTDRFLEHMQALKLDGWRTITMQQFEDWEKKGTPLPDKSFLLTFDDSRKDTFYEADPILEDLGFHSVMFVITGLSLPTDEKTSNFYLSKTELEYMQKSGRWELESHGDQDHQEYTVQSTTDLDRTAKAVSGHFLSNKFWVQAQNRFETDEEFTNRISQDLKISRKVLEDVTGSTVNSYAYPYNDFGHTTVNFKGSEPLIMKTVPKLYTYAFFQSSPSDGDRFNYSSPSAWMIRRIEPPARWSGQELIAELNRGRAKDLPYESKTFGLEWLLGRVCDALW